MGSVTGQDSGSAWLSLDLHHYAHLVGLLCLVSAVFKATQLYFKRKEQVHVMEQFPGPPCHWLMGHVNQFRRDGNDLDILVTWTKKYGGAFPVWFGNFSAFLFLTHPDYAKTVFGREEPKSDLSYGFIVPWIGKGLLVLSGQKWFQHRRLLTPGFHYDVLKPYVGLMSDCTKVMLGKWDRLVSDQKPVELFHHVSLMTLDTIMKCAFSYQSNCQTDSDNDYIKSVYELSYLIERRLRIFPYHNDLIYYFSSHGQRFRKALKVAHEHTERVIKQRKESLKQDNELDKISKKRHLDFLDILFFAKDENGQGLSDEDLRAEVDTFMFEGHDTTASGISWILYCLAKYPEHQEKCREEIMEVLGDRDFVEWEDLGKMPYTTLCIKESLRLFPPVPEVARELDKPITFCDGRSLPKGAVVVLNFYALGRNPSIWQDPEVFDPTRFSSENTSGRHPFAFLPFSAGPRNCIGQNFAMNEMKVAVSLILKRFKLLPDPENEPLKVRQVVLRSLNGIHVYLKKVEA
ncbi:cytochrome P450 4B1-like isoform X1 [Spea bombifrons]|uniref:cytochrome P450 4B1-like isoform X1 n=1 Tax=Spea bombifrons TaxID=233779 RepID=UPI00234A7015|nr:cytochrome P450 4B1-like isoform X1 [Spea bombifrons]